MFHAFREIHKNFSLYRWQTALANSEDWGGGKKKSPNRRSNLSSVSPANLIRRYSKCWKLSGNNFNSKAFFF